MSIAIYSCFSKKTIGGYYMHKKILFVDDEASLIRSMALGLNPLGYEIEPCEDGMSALKKLESHVKNHVDLDGIVVDIRLPDIDGIKLVKIIKFKFPGIPIILISGYADRYNRQEINDLQINAFLEKPFSPEELTQRFNAVVNRPTETTSKAHQNDEKVEVQSESAYILVKIQEDVDFFETYRKLYHMENVLYCDATKGDYDILMLLQSNSLESCRDICETRIKKVHGVKSVDFLGISSPVLDESTNAIILAAEDAMANETSETGRTRDMAHHACSYMLLNVEQEKLDKIYPTLRLDEHVVYCDYTTGKYNLVLFVTGQYFDEIDWFINDKIAPMDGVLKVKEYPVISLFEM